MPRLEPKHREPSYRDKETSEAVGDLAMHLYNYWSKLRPDEAERIGRTLQQWDEDFYALLEPERDPTQYLQDKENRKKVLSKLDDLRTCHTARFFNDSGPASVADLYKPEAVFASLDLKTKLHHRIVGLIKRKKSHPQFTLSHDDFRINHRQAARYDVATYGRAGGGGLRLVPSSSSSSSSFSI